MSAAGRGHLFAFGRIVLLPGTEWRKLRDAGVLAGEQTGEKVGKPSADQAEIARLRRDLAAAERKLATTETALTIMGKAHALLEQISESAELDRPRRRR